MAEKAPEEEKPAAPAASGGSKLMPIILIVNTVLMGAVLAVVLLRKPSPPSAAPVAASHAAPEASNVAGEGHGEAKGEGKGKEEGEGKGEGAGHGEPGAAGDPAGSPGPILKLENFIIQLRGTDTDRYVRVAFDLELGNENDRAAVQGRMPHIRDAIISYFSDRSLDELRGSEGMDRIKSAVSKKLDEILPGHHVRSVFITELVIQ